MLCRGIPVRARYLPSFQRAAVADLGDGGFKLIVDLDGTISGPTRPFIEAARAAVTLDHPEVSGDMTVPTEPAFSGLD